MPTSFDISSQQSTYRLQIQIGLATEIIFNSPNAFIVMDKVFQGKLKFLPCQVTIFINALEKNKEYQAIHFLLKKLSLLKLGRKNLLIAIGGGIIQDIVGFVASIYMRGIEWYYIPSTLLGMVDSCIGGKSSINLRGKKNILGTYYPPSNVIIDPVFINSLQYTHIIDGLCEAVKICFAHPDISFFENYLNLPLFKEITIDCYIKLIELSLNAKKWFIEKDEFDKNERLLLNFGHTFGHAIESASNYAISHGLGVGLGMVCAINFEKNYSLSSRVAQLNDYLYKLLRSMPFLGKLLKKIDLTHFIKAFKADKKHFENQYTLIIPDKKGQLCLEKINRTDECDNKLIELLKGVITLYGEI